MAFLPIPAILVGISCCGSKWQDPPRQAATISSVKTTTPVMQCLDVVLGALFRTVNELLGAAVFEQFYLARTAASPGEDEDGVRAPLVGRNRIRFAVGVATRRLIRRYAAQQQYPRYVGRRHRGAGFGADATADRQRLDAHAGRRVIDRRVTVI